MNSQRHILMVVNPKAGGDEKSELKDLVSRKVDDKNWSLEIYETSGKNDAAEIEASITSKKPYRIVVAGGDGTINFVAHILKDFDVPIGIIPSGSANGLAHNLNLPDEIEEQIEVALGDNLIQIDHLNVNDQTCLHVADLGLNAELIENFENSNIRGKFGYLLQSIPTLINSDSPFDFSIELKGKIINRTGILLAIANAQNYGTGATINPNGMINDGIFEVLIFKSFDTLEILKTVFDKANLNSDFAECFHTDNKVVITSSVPIPFQIDGEPMDRVKKVEASLYPNKLSIAVS